MTEHNNPPAFPNAKVIINGLDEQDGVAGYSPGLTMLDHFAGLAMQAMVNRESRWEENGIAEEAYKQANAMLKERAKWIK